MDGLEVSIVESERDFRELYELEESVYGDHGRENMCLGIARVDDVPAGNIIGVGGIKSYTGETITLNETEPFEKITHIFRISKKVNPAKDGCSNKYRTTKESL